MNTTDLNLKSLHLLSPEMREKFDEKIRQAVADCRQREKVTANRKIELLLKIKPDPDDPDDVSIEPVVKCSFPAESMTDNIHPMKGRTGLAGQLQFDFSDDAI